VVFEGGLFENCQPKDWFGGILRVFGPPPFLNPRTQNRTPRIYTLFIYIYIVGVKNRGQDSGILNGSQYKLVMVFTFLGVFYLFTYILY